MFTENVQISFSQGIRLIGQPVVLGQRQVPRDWLVSGAGGASGIVPGAKVHEEDLSAGHTREQMQIVLFKVAGTRL